MIYGNGKGMMKRKAHFDNASLQQGYSMATTSIRLQTTILPLQFHPNFRPVPYWCQNRQNTKEAFFAFISKNKASQ
jgi:hypothetical protein